MTMHLDRTWIALILLAAGASLLPAPADDWPTFRHDPARSGVTAEALGVSLQLQWTYQSKHPPQPAWPEPAKEAHRMPFDYAYQVAAAGGSVYFGSSADHKVYALDAATGQERWSFFTDAPIRFAPMVYENRVLVASDDGLLYCLAADTGNLVWQFRGGPRDERVLGNEHMISRWPLRTGVAVVDDIAYFAAGMWPAEGVYVYALRVEDGSVVWKNDSSGSLYIKLPHPTAEGFSGVAPQGNIVVHRDMLLVPTGRSVPAGFDRNTGRLLYYRPGWPPSQLRQGGSWTCAAAGLILCGRHPGGPDIDVRIGEQPPASGDGLAAWDCASGNRRLDLPGKHRAAIGADAAYFSGSGQVTGYDLKTWVAGKKREECLRWETPHGRAYSLIATANAVIVGGQETVTAMDAARGGQVWQAPVPGQARGLAVADGRLLVSTSTGHIACFAAQPAAAPATVAPAVTASPYPDDELTRACAALAERIIKETGVTSGYCLDLGAGDARLAYELAKRSELNIYCVEPDADKVAAARKALDAAGLYGVRVTVHQASPGDLPHPEYFANLVVLGAGSAGELDEPSAREVYRVLRPCGGIAYLTPPQAGRAVSAETLRAAGVPADEIQASDAGPRIARGPLPGAGAWTHQYGDAGKSSCSNDDRVKWPLKLLWFGRPGPAEMMSRHWGGPAPVAINGRMFVLGQHTVLAVDAYNGHEQWRRDLRSAARRGARFVGSNFAADDDSVYVAFGSLLVRLDAATGETRRLYPLPAETSRLTLDQPQTFDLPVDDNHSGQVTIEATAEGISIKLVTVDDKVTNRHRDDGPAPSQSWEQFIKAVASVGGPVVTPALGDSWELFFDFRPAQQRGGLYGPGAFQTMVVPATAEQPSASYKPAVGPKHPSFAVSGKLTETGGETAVALSWTEVEKLVGARPAEFGFGVALNSSDDGDTPAARTHRFAGVDSYRVTNGWASLVLDPAKAGPDRPGQAGLPAELTDTHVWGCPMVLDDLIIGTAGAIGSPQAINYWGTANAGAASDHVFALSKNDGRPLWTHAAEESISHNDIAAADGFVFFIDATSNAKLEQMKRRGDKAEAKRVLVALDARTGEEVWRTSERLVGGAHVLSAQGAVLAASGGTITVYEARDGKLRWSRDVRGRGVPLIVGNTIYAEPNALDLQTGEPPTREHPLTGEKIGWNFRRAYGCGGVSASSHLLFFRSGALGFCDLTGDTGTHNFGGVRPGCFVNLISANGLALAPEGTSACTCAYNYQTSLALIPAEARAEDWSVFSVPTGAGTRLSQLRINLGSAGDRRDADGKMWLGFPRPIYTGAVPVPMVTESAGLYRRNADDLDIRGTNSPWLYASGCEALRRADLDLVIGKPVVAPPCEQAPAIDGALDDACWDGRHRLPVVDENSNQSPRISAFLRSDADNLYLAFECRAALRDGQPVPWTANTAGEDASVWADDSWQVFLTDRPRQLYLRLGVAASGARYDAKCTYARQNPVDKEWTGPWTSEAAATPDAWSLEMAIPWQMLTDLGLQKDTLRLNILGLNRTGVGPEQVMLRYPGMQDFDRCEYFTDVALEEPTEPDPRSYTVRLHFVQPPGAKPGQGACDVRLQDKVVLQGLDAAGEAGAPNTPVVKQFEGVQAGDTLTVELIPRAEGAADALPIVAALEVYEG